MCNGKHHLTKRHYDAASGMAIEGFKDEKKTF